MCLGAVCVFPLQAVASLYSEASTPARSPAQVQPWAMVPCCQAYHPGPLPSMSSLAGSMQADCQGCSDRGSTSSQGGKRCLKTRNRVTRGQLWVRLAAGSKVQGSERWPEGPTSSRSVSSVPWAQATCCWSCWLCLWSGWLCADEPGLLQERVETPKQHFPTSASH